MKTSLEVLFTPAEFATLKDRALEQAVCVVFDVLRATSTMVTALGNGAAAIVPVAEISEALAYKQAHPEALLAGERDGVRIEAALTGGVAFDLGNSPREFARLAVQGRTIVMSTTNGTRGLRACAHARAVLAGSFLNLRATAHFVEREHPAELLLVCGGTYDQAAYEDVLCAGALCGMLWHRYAGGAVADSALMARRLFDLGRADLTTSLGQSRNGRRLLGRPELRADVAYCAQRNICDLVAQLGADGLIRKSE